MQALLFFEEKMIVVNTLFSVDRRWVDTDQARLAGCFWSSGKEKHGIAAVLTKSGFERISSCELSELLPPEPLLAKFSHY